ncbi:MAG: hypothetical protein R3C68_12860 [Myxococcota bacterium]
MTGIDIDRLVRHSAPVQWSDLDLAKAGEAGLSPAEVRILRYMSDTETHTMIYLR